MSNLLAHFGPPPFWANKIKGNEASADSTFTVGREPDYAPRLPIRIVPTDGSHSLSASTVRDIIDTTQKIITYIAYEVVNGVRADFANLKLVDRSIIDYSTLQIEPFREGSFVIPTALNEIPRNVNAEGQEKELSGSQIVERFADVMENAQHENLNASIGLVQSIENLGIVLRREAEVIEFSPVGFKGAGGLKRPISVTRSFIEKVTATRKRRQDPKEVPDSLVGVLIAVDLTNGKLKIKTETGTVSGTFSSFMTDTLVESLRKRIRLHGVVELQHSKPRFIRAFFSDVAEE
ncbi:MAG: hypothetical protein V4719_24120 [Planctomycetota bacterium]